MRCTVGIARKKFTTHLVILHSRFRVIVLNTFVRTTVKKYYFCYSSPTPANPRRAWRCELDKKGTFRMSNGKVDYQASEHD
jgi:hypothetical protein